jgi:hypothetical protein
MPIVDQDYLQTVTESTFLDSGTRLVYSATLNSYNEEVVTYSPAATALACGFQLMRGARDKTGQIITVDYDAECRISLDDTISELDRWRFGGVDYDIEAVQVKRTCKILLLKKVVTDS